MAPPILMIHCDSFLAKHDQIYIHRESESKNNQNHIHIIYLFELLLRFETYTLDTSNQASAKLTALFIAIILHRPISIVFIPFCLF
ncbi:hypothetical protein CW304_27660 [Bacillus sp. UFRGS-B20]|nr:hypothetical protein CW304_27660 [Bacillus sp. UFRGS-B20]